MSFAGINRLSGSRRSAGFGGEWKKQHRGRKEIRDGDYNASFALFWGFVRRLPLVVAIVLASLVSLGVVVWVALL